MKMFSPKIEIINHIDELINRVDIEFEQCLEKYSENQQLKELKRCFQVQSGQLDEWPESTKVVDYLNQVRMRTIEELRKEQKNRVDNSSEFNHLKVEISDEKQKEELRIQLFSDKFYFKVKPTKKKNKLWYFNLFIFVTDFYMSPSEIAFLE